MALVTALHDMQLGTSSRARQLQVQHSVSAAALLAAQVVVELPWQLLAPALLAVPYYYIVGLQMPLGQLYWLLLLLCSCASCIAGMVSLLGFNGSAATSLAVLVVLAPVAVLQAHASPSLGSHGMLRQYTASVSYGHWAVEALALLELREHRQGWSNVVVATARSWQLCGLAPGAGNATSSSSAGEQDPALFLSQELSMRSAAVWPCQSYVGRDMALLGACTVVLKVLAGAWMAACG